MENKEKYLAPVLTVVSFQVERGFQTSNQVQGTLNMFFGTSETHTEGYDDQCQQNWASGSWDEGGGSGWTRW